jgi:TrmH family RNA methyltransferase
MLHLVRRITSRQNARVADYRAIAAGDVPDRLLLDGLHLLKDALDAGLPIHDVLVLSDARGSRDVEALVDRSMAGGAEIAEASAQVMDAVSPVRSPSRVVALASRPAAGTSMFDGICPLVAVACDVQDPGNLGAIVRVAEAAGAAGLIAAGRSADPFGWKALRGSMGSALRLPITMLESIDAAVLRVREAGCRIVATVPRDGDSLYDTDLRRRVAVLIGSEGDGLSHAVTSIADDRVTIPMATPVESLNAAVTAALVLYEARRQRS